MTAPFDGWKPALTPVHRAAAGLCLKAGTQIVPFHAVARVDTARIEDLEADVHLLDGSVVLVTGIDAVELAMLLKPSVLEGRRLRWAKRAWWVHNWVGHPLMQLLALVGLPRWGMWVHDATVPRPRGPRLEIGPGFR